MVAEFRSPQKVYTFKFVGDYSIPKSVVKCTRSATKRVHVCSLLLVRRVQSLRPRADKRGLRLRAYQVHLPNSKTMSDQGYVLEQG